LCLNLDKLQPVPNLTATIKDGFVRALKDGLEDVKDTSITLSFDNFAEKKVKSAAPRPVPPDRRLVIAAATVAAMEGMAVDLADEAAVTAVAIDTLPTDRFF
jgi:anti-sigma factor RsiW